MPRISHQEREEVAHERALLPGFQSIAGEMAHRPTRQADLGVDWLNFAAFFGQIVCGLHFAICKKDSDERSAIIPSNNTNRSLDLLLVTNARDPN